MNQTVQLPWKVNLYPHYNYHSLHYYKEGYDVVHEGGDSFLIVSHGGSGHASSEETSIQLKFKFKWSITICVCHRAFHIDVCIDFIHIW